MFRWHQLLESNYCLASCLPLFLWARSLEGLQMKICSWVCFLILYGIFPLFLFLQHIYIFLNAGWFPFGSSDCDLFLICDDSLLWNQTVLSSLHKFATSANDLKCSGFCGCCILWQFLFTNFSIIWQFWSWMTVVAMMIIVHLSICFKVNTTRVCNFLHIFIMHTYFVCACLRIHAYLQRSVMLTCLCVRFLCVSISVLSLNHAGARKWCLINMLHYHYYCLLKWI